MGGDGSDVVLGLLDRAYSGDPTAERELMLLLFDIIEASVTRKLAIMVAGRIEKEEIISEVLLHLRQDDWRNLRKFDRERRLLAPWVFRVTSRKVVDILRKDRARNRASATEEVDLQRSPESGPEHEVWRAEVLDLVARQLRPVDFLLLQWIYFHGMSRQQIAAKLQIPVDTANKRIERAVARAREILVSANDDS